MSKYDTISNNLFIFSLTIRFLKSESDVIIDDFDFVNKIFALEVEQNKIHSLWNKFNYHFNYSFLSACVNEVETSVR